MITKVDFFVDGSSIGTSTLAPYGVSWPSPAVGTHTLTATATEMVGSGPTAQTTTTTSPAVTVTVNAAGGGGGGGATPPTVSLSPLPPTTTSVNARITLSANAAPGSATTSITKVEFFAGTVLVGTATTAPYTAVWIPQVLGTYGITAKVTDNTSATATSTPATVAVNGTLALTLTSPSAGVTIPVNTPQQIAASASASNGTIVSVQFLANGTAIGTANSFPYVANWTPTTPGTYTLLAVGTDNTGAIVNSSPITVTVGSGTAPTVSIASPAVGASLGVGTSQTIVANAVAGSGTIVNVQFFANGALLGTDTTFPYNQTWTPTGIGSVDLTAVATDSLGNRTTSNVIPVTVAAVSAGAPVVAITSPQSGASLVVGATATVAATATDADGTIAKVDFFANGVLLGTDTSYPYSVSFTPAATGKYTFTAVATDNGGNVTTSSPLTVTVSGGTAPSVAIVAPTASSALDVNVTQTILATATSASGVINSVEFFVNGVSLSAKNTFPYSASWTPTAVGTYALTARATDNFGNVTESAAVILAVSPGSPNLPSVALTSTPNGSSVTVNQSVFVSATARDPDGTVSNVEFYVNDRLIGSKATSPYFVQWVPATAGSYTIKAIVTDDAGNRVTSAASVINATTQVGSVPVTGLVFNDPTVDATATTSPAPFVPVKVDYGSKLIIRAAAVKDDGTITNVQFYANGVNIASLTAAPYFTTYQLNTLSDVVLTALVTDSSGNTVYTNPILISTQPSLGAAGSVVTLVSPLEGATYVNGGQIVFSATHNFGTVVPPKIDFYVNGSQFTTVTTATGGAASSPYQYIIGLTRAGTYIIHAVGRSGNTTTVSAPARITVTSSRAPTVAITSPAVGTSYTVGTGLTIAANASSTTGLIQNVQFFVNGAALSTKSTTPYTAAWNPGAAGTYTLTVLATDDSGNQTLSAPLVLTLVANAAPSVAITNPAVGTAVNAGSIVNLVAAAADADGTVASVRFLANGNAVGTAATAAPFSTSWTPTVAGTYTIIAQATDNSGNVTNSAPITVNVAGNRAPAIAFTSPNNGSVVRVGTSSTVTASASDTDGTIASVQFFANGVAIAPAVTTLPYRVQWTPAAEGIYRITSVAIDNAGAATTSSTLTILAVGSASGGSDNIYTGDYSGNGEIGRFAVVTVRGKTAAFIGYSTTTVAKTYFFSGLPVDGNGAFLATDAVGRTLLTANTNDTGLSGSLDS
ncbi:MAG: Ig-like domain-containing protein, partial [Verrucomicrobia bacterium]|nr:Ig-like domain-containing protein [Verrucomicrobiota bacterium]